jgi:hypothetical protein
MDSEFRERRAESVLHQWACGGLDTPRCKSLLAGLGYEVDFRQPDLGAYVEAWDSESGRTVELGC